jgi:hypothetical protein
MFAIRGSSKDGGWLSSRVVEVGGLLKLGGPKVRKLTTSNFGRHARILSTSVVQSLIGWQAAVGYLIREGLSRFGAWRKSRSDFKIAAKVDELGPSKQSRANRVGEFTPRSLSFRLLFVTYTRCAMF